jgi:hypothetical protein
VATETTTTIQGENEGTAIVIYVYKLAEKIISILSTIVFLALFAFLLLLGAYPYALLGMEPGAGGRADALVNLERVMFTVLDKLIPIGQTVLRVAAPFVVILLAILLLKTLVRSGATSFDLGKLTSDLPSMLALIIIVTICLLPLSGLGIPDVLNNVALVVVGFYFGKREHHERASDAAKNLGAAGSVAGVGEEKK